MPDATMPPHDELVDSLVQTSFLTMGVLNRVAAEHDLSLTQLRVLAILRDRRLRMTALAGYLGLDKSTMSGLVDRAEKRGLLERGRHAGDGRAVDVTTTAVGAALADDVYVEVAASLAPTLDVLTPAERRRLSGLLTGLLHEPR